MKKGLGWGGAFWILGAAAWAPALAFAGAAAKGDQVELTVKADRQQVEVGDSLTLSLEFKQAGSGSGFQTGDPGMPIPLHFDVGSWKSLMSTTIIDQKLFVVLQDQATLTATQPGVEQLGPFTLTYLDSQLGKRQLQVDAIPVTVTPKSSFSIFSHHAAPASQPPPGGDLSDVKPLLPESYPALKWVILALLALAVGVFVHRMRRRRGPPPLPPLSDEERWKGELKRIFAEDLAPKEFSLRLSLFAREALQARYGFPAPDYTTGEILKALRDARAPEELRQAAEKCLRACDRVLYAEGALGPKDSLRAWAASLLPRAARKK